MEPRPRQGPLQRLGSVRTEIDDVGPEQAWYFAADASPGVPHTRTSTPVTGPQKLTCKLGSHIACVKTDGGRLVKPYFPAASRAAASACHPEGSGPDLYFVFRSVVTLSSSSRKRSCAGKRPRQASRSMSSAGAPSGVHGPVSVFASKS